MKYINILWVSALFLMGSCTTIPQTASSPAPSLDSGIEFYRGTIKVDLGFSGAWDLSEVWPDSANDEQISEILKLFAESEIEINRLDVLSRNQIPSILRLFYLSDVSKKNGRVTAVYSLDTLGIKDWIRKQYSMGNLYFSSELFLQDSMPVFELLLPVDSVPVPDNPLFLPNSARTYRSGTHRGIDFQANWGTPFRSIAEGVVVRADHEFVEFEAGQWQAWAEDAATIGRTPDDLFYNVFMGRALIIDHGFNLFPGYRTISVYAHLSDINKDILPGTKVLAGQILGITGNSGTLPAARGELGQSHLHLEVILQGPGGDIYLGRDTDNKDLYPYLSKIFIP